MAVTKKMFVDGDVYIVTKTFETVSSVVNKGQMLIRKNQKLYFVDDEGNCTKRACDVGSIIETQNTKPIPIDRKELNIYVVLSDSLYCNHGTKIHKMDVLFERDFSLFTAGTKKLVSRLSLIGSDVKLVQKINQKPNETQDTDYEDIFEQQPHDVEKNKTTQKGDNDMLNKLFGKFGKVGNKVVALSATGKMVVKKPDGDYVCYNEKDKCIENVSDITLDLDGAFYYMPSIDVGCGDVIYDKGQFYSVVNVSSEDSVAAVNLQNGVRQVLVRQKTLFGSKFFTKVTNIFGNGDMDLSKNPMMLMMLMDKKGDDDMLKTMMMMNMMGANKGVDMSKGFGEGMNPMMLTMLMDDEKTGEDDTLKTFMLMNMMGGQQKDFNPMMLMLMDKKGDSSEMLKMMMLMGMMNQTTQTV